jgi:peroxiredoxin
MRLLFAALVGVLCLAAADPGQRAPGFALMDSNGDLHDLYDFRGKPVIVEFMQTTCPHCADFTKVLAPLASKYAGKLQILSVAIMPQDNPQTLGAYVKGHNLSWPHLVDMGQMAFSYVRQPNLNFPTIYLIDGNGTIVNHWEQNVLNKGIFEGDQLSREIDKLISSPAVSGARKK